jgi:hypothetical protein
LSRFISIFIAAFLIGISPAAALTRAGAPAKFSIPFANSAPTGGGAGGATYPLPTNSQIGITNCAASLTDGFPPKTMQAVSAGGCAPFGQDINGILKQITQWNQQTQAGAAPVYDSSFSSSIGGYPEGSILSQSAAPYCFWISQVDNNTSNPDTGGANWTSACPGGGIGGTSTGSANAQVVTTTPFKLAVGSQIAFIAGFTNTASLQINVNGAGLVTVKNRTLSGLINMGGGEVQAGTIVDAFWDGSFWEAIGAGQPITSVNVQGGNYTVATTDCGRLILMNGTFSTITLPAPSGFALGCVITVNNSVTNRAQVLSGFPVPNLGYCGSACLWPQQTLSIYSTGSTWVPITPLTRYLVGSGITIYVAASGCNDNNDGLTSGSPMCTINTAIHMIQQSFETLAVNPAIQLADGTYNQGMLATGVGDYQSDGISILGHPGSPANVIINPPANTVGAFVRDGGVLLLNNLELSCANSGALGVNTSQFSTIDLTNVIFGSCDGHGMMEAQDGGHIDLDGGIVIVGNAGVVFFANGVGAQFEIENQVISCTGSPSVGIVAESINQAEILMPSVTFSGCGTLAGQRYVAASLGLIQTQSGNASYIPGSSSGTPTPGTLGTTGGLYQ